VTDAVSIITDFDLLMTRFRVLDETGQAPQGWYSDWELLREKGRFTGDTRIWWDFARTNRHHFQKVGWESWRVLFQAAMDHADDSPVTIAAESFYARGKAGWTWLQYVNRPKKWVPNPLVAVMAGHTGDITGLQSLPNGLVVSSSADSTLRLWDPARGSCVAVLCGHQGGVGGMKVSEDGRILSWAEDGTLRLWDGLTGASVASLGGHSKSIDGAAFLSEGRVLSWSSDGDLRIWTKNGSCAHILRGNGRNVKGACSLSDNGVAAWSWDPFSKRSNKLCIWNTKTGKRVHLLKGHQSGVYGAAELSVGQIVSWCHDIRLWDRKSGECLMEFTGHSEAVSGVIDISNDRMLSWSNDTTIRIWDKKSGNCVKVFKGHEGNIEGVWLDANQKMLSWDDDGLICLWELETGGCVGVFQTKESEFNEKVVLPTGKLLSVAGRCIDLWRLEGINISKKPVGHRREISGALVVNEKQILSYAPDGLFCFWKTESGEFIRSLDAHRKDAFFNYYRCIHGVSLHPNGNLLSVAFSGTLKFWNTSIRKSLVVIDGGTGVNFLILPNGDVVSWNCEDNFLRIWSGENGECLKVLKGHRSFVRDVDVISGDRIVSYSWDGTIRIWNQKSGKCVKVLHEHRKFNARSSADLTELGYGGIFTLNSGRFLSWCGDGNARFWDVSGVPRMVSLNGHSDAIVGAEEMPEGRILTFSDDKTLRLWDRISGECIALMTGHTAEVWGAEALDDGRIVSWSGDGTLRVWEPAFSRCLAIIRSPIDWQNDREEISAARPKSLIRHHALDFDINIHDCNYNAANEVLTAVCSRGLCLRIYNLIDY
jgi:WD40 repeat protein